MEEKGREPGATREAPSLRPDGAMQDTETFHLSSSRNPAETSLMPETVLSINHRGKVQAENTRQLR